MTLIDIITSQDEAARNTPFERWADGKTLAELEAAAESLEGFRRETGSLYEKVRALLFLATLHRFYLAAMSPGEALIPYAAIEDLRANRFDQAVAKLVATQRQTGTSPALSSALATAYRSLAFQTLADQVRRSVRQFPGNQWMFRTGHERDLPLRLDPALKAGPPYAVLHETTPVRMDLSHSAWSDIFFLAMDYPEGARVLNISVDLAVRGTGQTPRPPVEAFLRVIDEPVLRLVSVDLNAQAEITELDEVFDFSRDYLGLLKAALIASGMIPAGLEGSGQSLPALLRTLTGSPRLGLELVSQVNDIPKGSRLAVSTNLLACLISACMRATRQIASLTGPLEEDDRRQVAARAILGEWLGGSGGGWQDSGGVWPGIKLIRAVHAREGDQEFGVSRGCLLPRHTILDVHPEARKKLEASLVLVHGGMSQDVGPILEMCTERYLLRSETEWAGRQRAVRLFDELTGCLEAGDIKSLAELTQKNYEGPIQTIIPWVANAYTDALIRKCREQFGEKFWGFWMLGGTSGGGMGFVFDPGIRAEAQAAMAVILSSTKAQMEKYFPFAVEPVVYDFKINDNGTMGELRSGEKALLSPAYYLLCAPGLLRQEAKSLTPERRRELGRFAVEYKAWTEPLLERMIPRETAVEQSGGDVYRVLGEFGFDPVAHERLRSDYRSGRVGLARNNLPPNTTIEDVRPDQVSRISAGDAADGRKALAEGRLAVVTLAGGAGSRWTKGAGVVKALNPFNRFGERYFNFIEVHLAKTLRAQQEYGARIPHLITTSYLTHEPIAKFLDQLEPRFRDADVHCSPGRSIGLRMIPTVADLRYLWEVLPQQQLDPQKQKVRDSTRASLMKWVQRAGEATDYTDNLPTQCVHPVGHWYELPNLLRNGVLGRLLAENPKLDYLLLHNIDTLGVSASPELLGGHMASGAAVTVEVIGRQFEDHGGGLALVNGRPRLVEGLCLPNEEIEFGLRFYNSGTYWITIDALLELFELRRDELGDAAKVDAAVRRMSQRLPSYITIKEVKKRWGRGQEDVFPVAQFERLLGDLTSLEDVPCRYVEVPRRRGQQLKDVAQLDPWLRDGSAAELVAVLI